MKCEYSSCYRQFDQYDIMEKHRKTHKKQPTELLYCSYCNEGFKKITTLFLHKVGNHQQLLRIAVKERPELERVKPPKKASKLNKISKHFN